MENEQLLSYLSPRKNLRPPPVFLPSIFESLNSPKPPLPPSSSSDTILNLQESLLLQNQQNSPAARSDPNLAWGKINLHRCKTAPAMAVLMDAINPSIPKPKFGSESIVRQACILLILYLSLGVAIYWFNRHHFVGPKTNPVVDALYFCIVTMCTIGFGDITPNSNATKLFSILFVLVGFGFIDILLSGMVSYVLDLQENYLLKTVQHDGDKRDLATSYIIDVKKGRMRIRLKVGLALGVVVLCIGIGVGVMHYVEHLEWLDSFYLSVMSVTTVGYGDRAFKTMPGRLFAAIWLLVSTVAVARAFLYLAEARVDKRHRRMAKWVLGQDMTVSQFLAADIDNNGYVSKSEFVIYKLKELGKVSEKDIMQISQKFDRLDSGNCGRICLADLKDGHH
ncbi:hypothetical protein ERO13_A06G197900v2 [Gossypium hirsutum]|uniref:Potassium channel domain-containing protein n=2 Tax=Gossypium TaxID=3633 RepID=A0ABR0PRQ1_GOSAR|nr:two-pore potassium channel 3-like [Gossypium arboreum]XP_040972316.1 two-pore potassium channel 3-like [Gossypium hirsutum]KAG4196855.1 hypothetical protein ERO13_A06G197900v2 [Gossypium hirsutum]KAG4196856.1 hypothetical protein ERO13_A06G197900v2 [Gossypium hirsutum]KAK5826926.1 hypothetical protein PVK06_021859 [Gossypium arboreum]